jgi:hypothetical protein
MPTDYEIISPSAAQLLPIQAMPLSCVVFKIFEVTWGWIGVQATRMPGRFHCMVADKPQLRSMDVAPPGPLLDADMVLSHCTGACLVLAMHCSMDLAFHKHALTGQDRGCMYACKTLSDLSNSDMGLCTAGSPARDL